ncbi:uncharacterized protein LOC130263079 isoform X2 [Oenanthe melanoleuca]|uniref:uncharacterized protein LOC130263079 isoform X2 n=1 Tax=Oenanthe melanoleuca TaxID=2939378 RepID=UPI0024C1278B|nr:uncharacterized protein LOC130263079 isoform X2 [Oenanthe melanoleuca]
MAPLAPGPGLFLLCPISARERGVTAESAARTPLPFPGISRKPRLMSGSRAGPGPGIGPRNRFPEPPGARGERELRAMGAGDESRMEPGPTWSPAEARSGQGMSERGPGAVQENLRRQSFVCLKETGETCKSDFIDDQRERPCGICHAVSKTQPPFYPHFPGCISLSIPHWLRSQLLIFLLSLFQTRSLQHCPGLCLSPRSISSPTCCKTRERDPRFSEGRG